MKALTVTSVTKDSPGAGQVTIVCSYADETFRQPAQRTSVGEFPGGYRKFSRHLTLTDKALFWLRNGADGVALKVEGAAAIALAFDTALTFTPRFTTQPANASTSFAKQVLTASGTVSDGDQVVCGGVTYTFKTTLSGSAGQVLINGSAANALINLKAAIDHTGTAGTDYVNSGTTAVINPQVKGGTITATTLQIVARAVGTAANAYATTETGANLAWGAATMAGGTAAAAFPAVITSELSGTTYAWYESADGVTWGSALASAGIYSGTATATLTITPTDTSKNGYSYKCIATNGTGGNSSTAAVLTVT